MSSDELKTVKELLASDKIEEAEKMMVELLPKSLERHGQNDLALGMAEYYYIYGTILVQKIEANIDVFGEGIQKANKQFEDGENEEESSLENANDQEQNEQESNQKPQQEPQQNQVQGEQPTKNQQTNQEEDENNDEELQEKEAHDEFQIAWENLEAAKVILEREFEANSEKLMSDKTIPRNLAKVYFKLGELEMWRECFEAAEKEHKKCLELRLKCEDTEKSRDIAESYFVLGNVYLYIAENNYEELALKSFANALQILENILSDELKLPRKDVKAQIFNEGDVLLYHLNESFLDNDQTKELKQIIKLIYNKIEDVKIGMREKDTDEFKKLVVEMKKLKEQQKNIQQFSKPPEQIEAPIKNLGTFGNALKRKSPDQPENTEKENGNNNFGDDVQKKVKSD